MIRRIGLSCALIAACWIAGSPAHPEETAALPEAHDREVWQQRFREAQDEVDRARRRHAEALDAYQLMRHRNRGRGEAKRVVVEELQLAEAAVPEAERKLEALRVKARRAGVPRRWTKIQPRATEPAAPDPGADGLFEP